MKFHFFQLLFNRYRDFFFLGIEQKYFGNFNNDSKIHRILIENRPKDKGNRSCYTKLYNTYNYSNYD